MIGFWIGVVGCAIATVILFALSIYMYANKYSRFIGVVGIIFAIFFTMVIIWTSCNADKVATKIESKYNDMFYVETKQIT